MKYLPLLLLFLSGCVIRQESREPHLTWEQKYILDSMTNARAQSHQKSRIHEQERRDKLREVMEFKIRERQHYIKLLEHKIEQQKANRGHMRRSIRRIDEIIDRNHISLHATRIIDSIQTIKIDTTLRQ